MSVTDEIKSRLDIVNYIQQFVPLKRAGRNYKACCPFHSEKTPSFVVNPETQTWRCFGSCADGGDIFSFAQKYHGWVFPEALNELGKLAGVEVQQQSAEQKQQIERLDQLRGLMQAAADYYHEQLGYADEVLRYVRDRRGFTDETIVTYGIGYAPDGWQHTHDYMTQLGYHEDDLVEVGLLRRNEAGRVYDYFRNRLVIPIRDERGRVIGFGARALSDEDNPKYLNSPQTPLFDKSRVLFGLDRAKRSIRDSETAVIVEGYMDVIQAHQAGFMNVVAQMGTAMTETQLKMLAPRWARKIVLALDADAAGQNATMRSLEVARGAMKADYGGKLAVDMRILQIPGAKDPDDLIRETPDEWADLVDGALPVADYVIAVETAALPPKATVHEREAVARRLLPMLLASENDLHRQDNIQKLAMRLHIAENSLLTLAAEQQRIEESRPPRRAYDEPPPDLPPLDYGDLDAPPDDEDSDYLDYSPVPRPAPPSRPKREVARWEADCLSGLLQDPDLLYQINRKLRELAGTDLTLLNGPLADFGVDDFSHSDYQILVQTFMVALDQDELAPLDYLREQLDDMLRQVLEEEILISDMDRLRPRLRHGLSADLAMVLKQAVMNDRRAELVRNALRLRQQRIEREREDLYFLMMEADHDQQMTLRERINLSIMAKRLIDDELQHQGKQVY
ncbi:MAG: DNA primase [Anaerolineaceae bacterium]|nr:DNA primase [Anaerolineaceae bacterium]